MCSSCLRDSCKVMGQWFENLPVIVELQAAAGHATFKDGASKVLLLAMNKPPADEEGMVVSCTLCGCVEEVSLRQTRLDAPDAPRVIR